MYIAVQLIVYAKKGFKIMKEINLSKATEFTSPNPLTLICSENADGSTNLAPVCFVSYLSFNPPMFGFAMGKTSHTGKRVRETGNVIITVPGSSLNEAVMFCGSTSGKDTKKVEEFKIDMQEIPGTSIEIPTDTKLAFVAKLNQTVDTGDHYFYICDIENIMADETKEALFAWNGYTKAAPAQEK